MWGWLSSLVDGIKSVWQGVLELPSKIAESLTSLFDKLENAIGGFFEGLLNGIKDIFIPDTEELNTMWENTTDQIATKFGFAQYDLEQLFDTERVIEDVETDYSINGLGTMHIKVMDSTFLLQGITFFRPYIRGFIVLLCVFYNIRMAVGFFGYSSGEIKSASKENG